MALCYTESLQDRPRATAVDEIDRQLISLLRNDARTSVAALAKALKVSRGTVQNRMARLEADGTIASYTIRLKPAVEEHRIRALMTVAVEGNRVDGVIKALRGDPAVTTLHSTNGRWDIVVELRADSLEAFDRVLARIQAGRGDLAKRNQSVAVNVQVEAQKSVSSTSNSVGPGCRSAFRNASVNSAAPRVRTPSAPQA